MNFADAGVFLAKVKLLDNRKVDQAVIALWQEALFDVSLDDALAALHQHSRESTEWLTPAIVMGYVRRYRADRKREHDRVRHARELTEIEAARAADIPQCDKHPGENVASCRVCFPRQPRRV